MARRAVWIDTRVATSTGSAAQEILSLMVSATGLASQGLTLTRTIVSMSFFAPTAVSDGIATVDMGIGVVSREAFVASVVPDPDLATDRPPRGWVYRDQRTVLAAASMSTGLAVHVMADVRGARRVDDGELVLILDVNAVDGTAFDIVTRGLIRCVFLMP